MKLNTDFESSPQSSLTGKLLDQMQEVAVKEGYGVVAFIVKDEHGGQIANKMSDSRMADMMDAICSDEVTGRALRKWINSKLFGRTEQRMKQELAGSLGELLKALRAA